MKTCCLSVTTIALLLAGAVTEGSAQGEKPPGKKNPNPAYTSAAEAGPDFLHQGEYVNDGGPIKAGMQVIARGDGKFVVNLLKGGLPGAGWDGKSKQTASAHTTDGKVIVEGKSFKGVIAEGKFTGVLYDPNHTADLSLHHIVRQSPTIGAKAPPNAVVLFDGTSADEWQGGKLVEGHHLNNGITSKKKFKDFTLHLEFRLPFMPYSSGQGRANSGVYLQDRYELQVLDSFGLKGLDNECGGFYQQFDPLINMCLPPLTWQTYDIDFKAARFADGKRTAPAVATVKQNGVIVQDKQGLKGPTPGGKPESNEPLGIQLQNHGNPVYFRNIWVVENK
jgi:3-keto-disaccharide hydrolase